MKNADDGEEEKEEEDDEEDENEEETVDVFDVANVEDVMGLGIRVEQQKCLRRTSNESSAKGE